MSRRPSSVETTSNVAATREGNEEQGPTRALLYLRVSTKEQAEMGGEAEGFSIPGQREACRRKADSLGADVVGEFVDRGESARSANRPELQRLLVDIRENPVDYLIVHKVDRLARNRVDDVEINLALQKAGVQLVSATENIDETPSGALLHGIMSTIAEFYSRNLANEVIKGSVQKAKSGGTVGRAPTGYRNVRRLHEGREIRTVDVDAERGPHMRWAFEAYAGGGWTVRTLCSELDRRGLKSVPGPKRPGKPLSPSNVADLLRHPYYKGLVVYRGICYPGQHQPLVTPEIWQQVQDVLDAQNSAGEKERIHHHYLKGSIFCGECGSRLIVSLNKNRHGTVYEYFVCLGRHQKRTTCTKRAMPIDLIEDLVAQHYRSLVLPAARVAEVIQAVEDFLSHHQVDGEIEQRQQTARIEQLNAERLKLLQAHYADAIPLDLLRTEQERISREMTNAQQRLDATSLTFAMVQANLQAVIALAQNCHTAYQVAGPRDRRTLNQAFFEKIYLDDQGIVTSDLAQPFAALLDVEQADGSTLPRGEVLATTSGGPIVEGHTGNEKTPPEDRRGQGVNMRCLVGAEGLEPPTLSV